MIVHDTAFEQPDNEQKGTRYWHRHTYDPCRDSVREDNVALEKKKGRREDLTRISWKIYEQLGHHMLCFCWLIILAGKEYVLL